HTFDIVIDAPRETVWDILWNQATYPEWTAVFSPGSRAVTTWQQGSKVLFVDGSNAGMVATVVENQPPAFMSFKHLGMVKDGVEDLDSDLVRPWAGALENYSLSTENGKTRLTVEMDITPEHKDYFVNAWPLALAQVKQLAESARAGKVS
ncbi:MAG TPA: SRPBCC domain-containing protein, partial [Cytophagales bacterium]